MNKRVCPMCHKEREDAGPKIIGEDKEVDSPHLVVKTKVMCNDCFKKFKEA